MAGHLVGLPLTRGRGVVVGHKAGAPEGGMPSIGDPSPIASARNQLLSKCSTDQFKREQALVPNWHGRIMVGSGHRRYNSKPSVC